MALVFFPSSSGVMLNYLQLILRPETKFMGDKMFYPSLSPSCSYSLLLLHALWLCLCPGIAPAGPGAAGGQVFILLCPCLPLGHLVYGHRSYLLELLIWYKICYSCFRKQLYV